MEAIKIESNHYILVDECEIKEGDMMYIKEPHPQGQIRKCWYIVENDHNDQQLMIDPKGAMGWGFCLQHEVKRIVYSTKSIEEDELRKLVFHKVKPIGMLELSRMYQDIYIETLGRQRAILRKWNPDSSETRRVANEIIESFKAGYKQAIEDDLKNGEWLK